MSRAVTQASTFGKEEEGHEMTNIDLGHEVVVEQKPQIVIQAPDLNLVIKQCCLERNDAIDLITSTDGNIKEAIKAYINQ